VTEQRSEIENLFQRMAARSAPVAAPAAVPAEAAVATVAPVAATPVAEEWPLFAVLRRPRRTWHAPHMMMPVEDPLPLTRSAAAPKPAPVASPAPVADETPASSLSPLEQLFRRAERTGQSQKVGSVFEPASAPPAAPASTLPPTPARMAPPPLKTRAAPSPARAPEAPVAVAPRQRDWQPLDDVPAHLFDRVGAR